MLVKHLLRRGQFLRSQFLRKTPMITRSSSNFVDGGGHATANDLPVPDGDWLEWYTRKNMRYNIVLGSGIFALIVSIVMVNASGVIFYNYSIPKYDPDDDPDDE